jgi:6-phosphogluconolactonase (cycloisomerase 2 family)
MLRCAVLGLVTGVVLLTGAPAALAVPNPAFTQVGTATPALGYPSAVAFSPDGGLVATANLNASTVSMFTVTASGALTSAGVDTATGNGPSAVAFSPDGKLLATADETASRVSMFSVSSDGGLTALGYDATGSTPYSVAFSPNGELLATANSVSDTVSVFTLASGGALTQVGTGTATGLNPYSVEFSPNGELLATANSGDGTVSVFSVAPGGALTQVGMPASAGTAPVSVAFSPDSGVLAATWGGYDKVFTFRVTVGGQLTSAVGSPATAGLSPDSVAFSPDGALLATANDTANNSLSVFSTSAAGGLTPAGSTISTASGATSVAFSPNGELLVTANPHVNTVSVFAGGAPTVQITSPVEQQTFTQGQRVATGFVCTDPPGAPGITACTDSNGASSPHGTLDTSTLGAHTYTVTATSADTLTSSTTVDYTVFAPSTPALNPPTPTPQPAPAPIVNTCPAATGQLSGNALGLITLGMTRAQASGQYAQSSVRARHHSQYFCVSAGPVQAGYPSRRLLKTLSAKQRRAVRGRVVLALTANRYYALNGVHAGTSLKTALKVLHAGPVILVAGHAWYMAPNGSATAIIEARHGTVQKIGTASKRLTQSRAAQRAFVSSFS